MNLGRLLCNGALFALMVVASPAWAEPCQWQVILEDPRSDWSGVTSPSGAGTPEQDLLSLSVHQLPANNDGSNSIEFRLQVSGVSDPLPPYFTWFASFTAPDADLYGVRMQTDAIGTPSYFSYRVPEGEFRDGRFVEAGSEIPAEKGRYSASGEISITVSAAAVHLTKPGDSLYGFNAMTVYVPGAAGQSGGAYETDTMPDDPGQRDGLFEMATCESIRAVTTAPSSTRTAGALPAGSLLALALLLGLRRRVAPVT